jgi:cellulose biosynthesis protein BcsQ
MTTDIRITNNGRQIPVVAFFGTKGGVGKTTISKRFAELMTLADSAPNVLLVDGDVHHRGMTVQVKTQTHVACNTVHDYVVSKNVDNVEAANITAVVAGGRPDSGSLFFVPASSPDSDHVFGESALIGAEKLLEILQQVIAKATQRYDCKCVVIDCGPIIDPYTAAAAMLADRAFIIGQNEPISFSSLKTYPSRIRDFYPEFRTDKMKIIINKVRGWEQLEQRKLQGQEEILASIPFTMDIVDVSEGLSATNDMQLMLFEDHIAKIIEKVFNSDYPELVPPGQSLLPREWGSLVQNPENIERAPAIKRLGMLRLLLPIGLLTLVGGAVLLYGASTQRHRSERAAQAQSLAATLKNAIAEAEKSSGSAGALREALQLAQAVDPGDEQSLNRAVKGAQKAGVTSVPSLIRQDTSRENMGIGILLVGVVVGGVGFSCSRSRKNYLSAIKNLRKGGAQWLMSEMKAKKSSRKTFDKLLKMSERV